MPQASWDLRVVFLAGSFLWASSDCKRIVVLSSLLNWTVLAACSKARGFIIRASPSRVSESQSQRDVGTDSCRGEGNHTSQ
eukprot:8812990-Pyramimonas_sp.AAC.1